MISFKKSLSVCCAVLLLISVFSGCAKSPASELNPKKPITITIWHYYNGTQKNAFDKLVDEFNETVGTEKGIVVEAHNQGDVSQLEQSVRAAVNKEVGSGELPDVFASYADTAFAVENMGLLANLDSYFSPDEQKAYMPSYIEEGRIGSNGELEIFPTAKSSEVTMINKTAWDEFSADTGADISMLETYEGIVETAESYYKWTDALTPGVPDDGKPFYGRDAVANLFIVGARQLGCEIFSVKDGQVTINLDKQVMRRIWDTYYIPRINGYFYAGGRFRSDDVRVGKLIALTGSTSSASYFPEEVVPDIGEPYPIEIMSLSPPIFEGAEKIAVQQGAGMVVTKSSPVREYASVLFLKWFTEPQRNLKFSCASGYLPVVQSANNIDLLEKTISSDGTAITKSIFDSLTVSFDTVKNYELYTSKAFKNGSKARKVLEYTLSDKATADEAIILEDMKNGKSRKQAVSAFDTDENFELWYKSLKTNLDEVVNTSAI